MLKLLLVTTDNRDGETGMLFDPNDPIDIRRQVERITTDSELRLRLGANGQAEARRRFHPKVIGRTSGSRS